LLNINIRKQAAIWNRCCD